MWGRTGGSVSLGYGRPSQERELEEERREEIKGERGRGRDGGEGKEGLLTRYRASTS